MTRVAAVPADVDVPVVERFSFPTRVIAGPSGFEVVGPEVAALGNRAVIVTDSGVRAAGLVDPMLDSLAAAGVASEVFDDVATDPSLEAVQGALAALERHGADVLLAVGGGSPIDTAKAAAVVATRGGSIADYEGFDRVGEPVLPVVAVPTTIGTGSEVTRGAVISDKQRHRKMVIVDASLYPRVAVLDPRAVAGLPPGVAAATGMDALAHAVEGYTTSGATPISDALCLGAVRLVGTNLRPAVAGDRDARYQMLYASCLAGAGFHNVGLGLAHALSSVVGGHFPVHHGVATGLFLPHVMRFNLKARERRFADIAVALGVTANDRPTAEVASRAPEIVAEIMNDIGVPTRLRDVDVPDESFAQIAEEALDQIDRPGNPRSNGREDLEQICRQAA